MPTTESATAQPTEQREIPIGSVWKYDYWNYQPDYARRKFGPKALGHPVKAMIEVTDNSEYFVHSDVYLRSNSRQGDFDSPGKGALELGRKLKSLRPKEFWGLVDQGLLKRIESTRRR